MRLLLLMLFIASIFIIVVFVDIAAGLINFFYNHKCPHCKERTRFLYKKYLPKEKTEFYIFHCPHCHKDDYVETNKILNEYHDT